MSSNSLWAITCLFEPVASQSRQRNYRLFRKDLLVPLVAVELAFENPFVLSEGDAEILVQIRGGSRMWQKERLLNIAIRSLPAECENVVWVDADMLFPDADWPSKVVEALATHPVVQPFTHVRHLAPSAENVHGQSLGFNVSFASVLQEGACFHQLVAGSLHRTPGMPCCGHVLAARRSILDSCLLYDCCVVGGGDTAFLGASISEARAVAQAHLMGEGQTRRYFEWAEQVFAAVGGNVGVVPGTVFHLWHGDLTDRKGGERHRYLSEIGFDPYLDLAPHPSGAWMWARDRPDLSSFMEQYFAGRDEDRALWGVEV